MGWGSRGWGSMGVGQHGGTGYRWGSMGVGQYSRELLGQHGIEFGWWAAGSVQYNLSTAVPMKLSKFAHGLVRRSDNDMGRGRNILINAHLSVRA